MICMILKGEPIKAPLFHHPTTYYGLYADDYGFLFYPTDIMEGNVFIFLSSYFLCSAPPP